MTLATVGADGRPSTRVVLIKGFDARGIVWYTNYESRKGRELAHHPWAALQFHWVELERVVRIEGRVEQGRARPSPTPTSQTRPLDSRLGAWASPQSQVIASRAVLVANAAKVGAQFAAEPAAPAALGRLPAGARPLGVLAGPQEPPARPAALPQQPDGGVAARAPGAVAPGAAAVRGGSETHPQPRAQAPARQRREWPHRSDRARIEGKLSVRLLSFTNISASLPPSDSCLLSAKLSSA